jgi:hypothetical protein
VEGTLIIDHDGVSGITRLPITLNVVDSPRPPLPFDLLEPANGDTIRQAEVEFKWEPSIDPNPADEVRYRFNIRQGAESASMDLGEDGFTGHIDTLGIDQFNNQWIEWWVTAFSNQDSAQCTEHFRFYVEGLGAPAESNVPTEFALNGIQPNPFNAATSISFGLDRLSQVKAEVFDISGHRVATLYSGDLDRGNHILTWDAHRVSSGVYLLRLESEGRVLTERMTLVR